MPNGVECEARPRPSGLALQQRADLVKMFQVNRKGSKKMFSKYALFAAQAKTGDDKQKPTSMPKDDDALAQDTGQSSGYEVD